MDHTRCKEMVWAGYHKHQCSRKRWKDGYCKQHHPDSVAKRREEQTKRYEQRRKEAPWYRMREMQKLNESLKSENARLTKALEKAAEEAYRNEVVDTKMEEHIIGEGKEYFDKKDWVESKLIDWGY